MDITEKYKGLSTSQSSCYINKLEKKTMVHEINVLAKALIKNEKRYVKLQESFKVKAKEMRKQLKSNEKTLQKYEQEIMHLTEQVKTLKGNEDHLLHDLVK